MKLTVELGRNSYPIYIENDLLKHAAPLIGEIFTGRRIMIISDDNVYPRYGAQLTEQLSKDYDCRHLILTERRPKTFSLFPESMPRCLTLRLPEVI